MPAKPILIVDGHLDMAYNALFYRRDLTQPVRVLREREDVVRGDVSAHADSLERRQGLEATHYTVTVTLPEMRKGRVGIMLSTIMARVQAAGDKIHNASRTQVAAYAKGQAHLHYYKALEREGEITFIKTVDDLDACVAAWEKPTSKTPVGLILSAESADPILGPDQVQDWWDAGLRSVSLTHFGANTYGHGTGTGGGLYPPAFPLMDALDDVGMVLDVTHASELSFWQIMDYWDGPLHASHCNCRALTPGHRHLSDEMIEAIVERGGVIGIVFAEQMLSPTWNWDDPSTYYKNATRPMKAAVDHIDHICGIAGTADNVALGTDLDGGFGRELAPIDYDNISDLQRFPGILADRGYSEEDVAKICHGNLIRLFKNAWSG
ncbi:MAG: membrane dipeptidase [Candidatus Latescibacteria bacterium]|nr:membrane dipeptidase [Candidatus Latescibacterota bacterium]